MLRRNQNGQAILIVLLSMVVALTVALSIIATSTSDIKLSTNEVNSERAFSAAESGAELALLANTSSQGSVNSGASYNATVTSLQASNSFVYPSNIASNDSGIIWFVSHDVNGNIACDSNNPCFTGNTVEVCWGTNGTPQHSATTPALEATVYYLSTPGNLATARIAKGIYDPNDTRRNGSSSNSYSGDDPGGSCTINGTVFAFHKQFDMSSLGIGSGSYNASNGLQFLTVKLLYNSNSSQPFGINTSFAGNSSLPSQGHAVTSTGTLSDTSRKVQVTKIYSGVPSVFDTAIFSPNSLAQ